MVVGGWGMEANFLVVLVVIFAMGVVLPLAENSVYAQAPTGPQGGAPPPPQQQQNPASQKPPTAAPQPPQGGVTIAVEVPIVTLEVVATTQHGDILTGLKKENFRALDEGVPQTITNFGQIDAPITMVVLMEYRNLSNGWLPPYAKHLAH